MRPKRIGFTFDLNRYVGGMCSIQGNMSNIPLFIQKDMSKLTDGDEISVNSYEKNDAGEYVNTHKIFKLVEVKN